MGTKFRTEIQREDEQKWEWVITKKEAEYSTSAQLAGSNDIRRDKKKWVRVSPKTEAASNTGSNDSRPVPPRANLRGALDDGRSLHKWRSIQGQYWLELQKVQRHIQYASTTGGPVGVRRALTLTLRQPCWNRCRSAFTTSLRTCTS